MKTIITNIQVHIDNLKVDDYYYSFDYKIFINDKLEEESTYESDHVWGDDKTAFRKLLKKEGYANQLALEKYYQ